MIRDFVSVGDKLELKKIILNSNESENEKIYKSQLIDIAEDDTATILMPIEKGRIIPLTVGDKYYIRFFTKKGMYQCKAVITGRSRMQNIYVLTVEFTSDLERHQRREFYRLECVLDIDYYVVSDAEISIMNKLNNNNFKNDEELQNFVEALEECKKDWIKGIIVDISGGGARVVSDKLHEYGNLIKFSIHFANTIEHNRGKLKAIIVSSEKMINRPGFFEHRIQFKDISKEEREAIIRYIFIEERKQRNKDKRI